MQPVSAAPQGFWRRFSMRRDFNAQRRKFQRDRIWFTPAYKFSILYLAPLVLVGFLGWMTIDPAQVRATVHDNLSAARQLVTHQPRFMLSRMEISGVDPVVAAEVAQAAGFKFPVSALDINLYDARARIEALSTIGNANLTTFDNGILLVEVEPTAPKAVFRGMDGLWLMTSEGAKIRPVPTRSGFEGLPYLAGEGADEALSEGLSVLDAARGLQAQVVGVERIGTRRWDVLLEDRKRILLPQDAPEAALQKAITLQMTKGVLDWDIAQLDLRLENRPMIRLRDNALARVHQDRTLK